MRSTNRRAVCLPCLTLLASPDSAGGDLGHARVVSLRGLLLSSVCKITVPISSVYSYAHYYNVKLCFLPLGTFSRPRGRSWCRRARATGNRPGLAPSRSRPRPSPAKRARKVENFESVSRVPRPARPSTAGIVKPRNLRQSIKKGPLNPTHLHYQK